MEHNSKTMEDPKELKCFIIDSLWMYKAFRRTVEPYIHDDRHEMEKKFVSTIVSLRNSEDKVIHLKSELKQSNTKIDLQRDELNLLKEKLKEMGRKLKFKKNRISNSVAVNGCNQSATNANEFFNGLRNEIFSLKTHANSIVFDFDKKLKRLNDTLERIREDLNSTTKVNDWRIAVPEAEGQ